MATTDPVPQQSGPLLPKLSPARGRLTPQLIARNQRGRLQWAMVEAVAQHGFAGVTLRELVGLAGVSKTTFYEHFDSKQDCFLETYDEIVSRVTTRVGEAYREPGDFHARLVRALSTFMELVVEEPAAASFGVVESLTLGSAGVAHREQSSRAFELMIQQSFEHSPSEEEVLPITVRAIAAGIRGVVYRRLRAGSCEDLPDHVEELVDWALGYQRPVSESVRRAIEAAQIPGLSVEPAARENDADEPDWDEPPDSRRSRAELTQRERIARAAARVVVEKGYEALSIPAISAVAGTSNQTFYENFSTKRDAFLSAFEILTEKALATTAAAFEAAGDRPEAIGAAIRAMLEHIAANDLFARLAFFQLPTAGPVALDHADPVMDRFNSLLEPGTASGGRNGPLPGVISEAVGSGIWSVIQHEIAHERTESLPELAPEITRVALGSR